MKKFYVCLIVFLFIVNLSFGQWVSGHYNSGNVAIGVSDLSPYYPFSVNTNSYSDGLLIIQDDNISIGDSQGDVHDTFININDPLSMINAYGAHFGINTLTTLATFQINDYTSMTTLGDASGVSLNYGTGYLGFNAARINTGWTIHGDSFHNGGGVMYNSVLNGDIYFAPIESTGTTSKTLSDADIKSRITFRINPTATYAKKMIVELSEWPDYVFNPSYHLRSLSEVKTFVNQNHHLPDMPSEKEVADKGLDLGEMNKLLTKKVEELMLYLIEKDKEISNQKEINLKMTKRIEALEYKLK